MERLPILALDAIMEFMDYPSRRTCRLVSKTLKHLVDRAGLSIKIDSREQESLNLSRHVNATEVQVLHLHLQSNDIDESQVRRWKTAILSGPVDNTWLNNCLLRKCLNLRVLILSGDSLTANDFTSQSEPYPVFQHLTQLHINLKAMALEQTLRAQEALSPITNEILDNWSKRITNNVNYLFTVVRSQALKVLFMWLATGPYNWDLNPLFKFLQTHRHSIESLILPNIIFAQATGQVDLVLNLPSKIKEITLWADLNFDAFELDDLTTYWRSLLLVQRSIEKLSYSHTQSQLLIEAEQRWLPSVLYNNSPTLTYIDLDFSGLVVDHQNVTLDMHLFRVTKFLKTLSIRTGSGATLEIRNLHDIPTAHLQELRLLKVTVGLDFDPIKFLKNLSIKYLCLQQIAPEGYFKDPKRTLQFIKLSMRCRELVYFDLELIPEHPLLPLSGSLLPKTNEMLLEPWLAKVEANGLPIIQWMNFIESRKQEVQNPAEPNASRYVEWEQFLPVNYIETMTIENGLAINQLNREQPFNLPRNAESFSVFINEDSQSYQILPNYKPYSEKYNDLKKTPINLFFRFNRDEKQTGTKYTFSLEDLGLPAQDIWSNTKSHFVKAEFLSAFK